jgi:hypothetical protein
LKANERKMKKNMRQKESHSCSDIESITKSEFTSERSDVKGGENILEPSDWPRKLFKNKNFEK